MEQEPNFELQPSESLSSRGIIDALSDYLDQDDFEFLNDQIDPEQELMTVEDVIGYVYGRLLEIGEDPDELLQDLGLFED